MEMLNTCLSFLFLVIPWHAMNTSDSAAATTTTIACWSTRGVVPWRQEREGGGGGERGDHGNLTKGKNVKTIFLVRCPSPMAVVCGSAGNITRAAPY